MLPRRQTQWPRVAIVGAGMSGILMGIKLLQRAIPFKIYEKAPAVGGTWRENTYPGLCCDVPSQYYRYSFEPNPEWTLLFSPGQEICSYLEKTARRRGVYPHIRFGCEITSIELQRDVWQLRTKSGEEITADIVVTAVGFLHKPNLPPLEGMADFEGVAFHSSRWNHDIAIDGKRVGIVGNGSTGVQVVGEITARVKALKLFQRTAQWIVPVANAPIPERTKRLFRLFPVLANISYRRTRRNFLGTFGKALEGDPKWKAWLDGLCEQNLESVKDPELRAKLTPTYKPACKRIVLSGKFYDAIQMPHAEVISDEIDHVASKGIATRDGRLHEIDILILATGYKAHDFISAIEIVGLHGRRLAELWANGPKAYQTVAIPGLPNFFCIIGPYSPVNNTSIISCSETQVGYIMRCIDTIARKHVSMSPKFECADEQIGEWRKAAMHTIWASGCKSWYQDKEGVPLIYPHPPRQFERDLGRAPRLHHFDIRPLGSAQETT